MLVERGVYIVGLELPRERLIRIGRLGRIQFAAGRYVYVGSAQSSLPRRVARHARRRKALRWHIDYLTQHAPATAAWAWETDREAECIIAARLAKAFPSVTGFGCSDCRCNSHLFACDAEHAARLAAELLGPPIHAVAPLTAVSGDASE